MTVEEVFRVCPLEGAVGRGWHGLVTKLVEDLLSMGWNGVLYQMKEKYGGLRFYPGGLTEAMEERICKAEVESERTCEDCGSEGRLRTDLPWVRTLCSAHYEPKKQ